MRTLRTDRAIVVGLTLSLVATTAFGRSLVTHTPPRAGPSAVVAQRQDTPVDVMHPQMRQAHIVGIQEELAAHGYRPGPADGVMGEKTRAALRAYQHDAGLKVTGIATQEVLNHLQFALPKVYAHTPAPAMPVYVGLVQEVQRSLQQRGYYQGAIDGSEGPLTQAAITQFQTDAGLPITGKADAALLKQLLETGPTLRRSS